MGNARARQAGMTMAAALAVALTLAALGAEPAKPDRLKAADAVKVKIEGKRVDKLTFSEADFTPYGKDVRIGTPADMQDKELDLRIIDAAGKKSSVLIQVLGTPRDAQSAVQAAAINASSPWAAAPAGGSLDIGDTCMYSRGSGKSAGDGGGALVALAFARNNVRVLMRFEGAAKPADFITLARAIDAKLVTALVDDKAAQPKVESTGGGKGERKSSQ